MTILKPFANVTQIAVLCVAHKTENHLHRSTYHIRFSKITDVQSFLQISTIQQPKFTEDLNRVKCNLT